MRQVALVVGACGAAFAASYALLAGMGEEARPLSLMWFVVVVVGTYAGFRAGLATIAASIAYRLLLFILLPETQFGSIQAANLAVFVGGTAIVLLFLEALRSARMTARERQRMLYELKRLDGERQAAIRKLESILSLVPVGIAIADDRSTRYIRINDEYARMLGGSAGTIGSRAAPPDDRPTHFTIRKDGVEVPADELPLQMTARTGERVVRYEAEVERDDGVRVNIIVDAAPLFDEDGAVSGSVAAIVDVTAIREMERALALSEERFRIAVDASPMFVFNQDADLRYTWVNALGLGFSMEQLIGATDAVVFPAGDAERVVALKRRAIDTATRMREELSVMYGPDLRTFDVTIEPMLGADGRVSGIIGTAFDVTDRKQIEEALREANRAKDAFASHVSHEMKTPLTVIKGNAELLKRHDARLTKDARADALGDIGESAEQLERIIDDLLVIARLTEGQSLEREPVRLQDIVTQCVERHRSAFPHRRIEARVDGDPGYASLSPSAITQVLMNLFSNAEKYSPRDAPIEVATSSSSNKVTVSVRDHGHGFPEDEAERLFSPFYRAAHTAELASGLGVGLSVCKRLVEAQEGRITARPAAGGGAEFTVSFREFIGAPAA